MEDASTVSAGDTHALVRIAVEAQRNGQPIEYRVARALRRTCKLIAANWACCIMCERSDPQRPRSVWFCHTARKNVRIHGALELLARGQDGEDPISLAIGDLPRRFRVYRRTELVPDERWQRCGFFKRIAQPNGYGDQLVAVAPLTVNKHVVRMAVCRAESVGPFGEREQVLVDILNRNLRSLWLQLYAHVTGAGVDKLPSYLRKTFELLLTGASKREVAQRLGLSEHTVHGYVKMVYRRLGVSSRAELMAKYLRDYQEPVGADALGMA